jgi:uncharacterized lipoprotein YbaY
MRLNRIVLATMALALMLGGPAIALAQQKATIQGQVTVVTQNVLPPNAFLFVSLEDAATGADLVALEHEGVVGGKAQPFSYSIQVDSSRIVAGARYRVIVEIAETEQSQNRLYSGVSVPFAATATGTTNVPQIQMIYWPARLGSYSSGTMLILIALGFLALGGLFALWRRMRSRSLVRRLA